MNTLLLLSSLLLVGSNTVFQWVAEHPPVTSANIGIDSEKLSLALHCRREVSPLVRLECYDNVFSQGEKATGSLVNAGPAWQRAMNQEKSRTDHSTQFLFSQSEGNNPEVVLTTPALGVPPPRPVLMLSCIDNITRLQVALTQPQTQGAVVLTLGKTRIEEGWFLRENGFLLESSRGLAGIEEIKRLMLADSVTIAGKNGAFTRLTFNISQLPQALKPLRQACGW
ncbi:type VI secretion system-associated protein VasI [Erwinia sorbitola]|uniref:Type VI secretion system-associated protein TagO n=1 Tax=Erwinia sorbitola TaxID=2681984 RepID=A0ABW9R8Y0_9GAMM|nr:type VI secretion system-associated protein VasI [Erwinia sorbitola]MTD26527.1 type VI secretion system-associated protein TagO [Erwinia sorbitola]